FLQKKNSNHSKSLLFHDKPVDFRLPLLQSQPLDDSIDEFELLKFPLCKVFDLADVNPGNFIPAGEIQNYPGKEIQVLGYLITTKPVHTIKNENMSFHTFIDAAGDWLDTIFFPQTAMRYPVTGKGFYSMKGKVVEEFGVYSVEV